jgi:hypothetical protein
MQFLGEMQTKGAKKGYCETPWLELLFSTLFWLPFSISTSLGVPIAPQRSYTTSDVQKGLG